MPTPSCPGMNGGCGFTGQSPAAAWMSVWHSPEVCIRTSTWPGPGSGTGTSLISSLAPSSGTTAAFIVLMALSPVLKFLAGYLETGSPVLVRRHVTSFLCFAHCHIQSLWSLLNVIKSPDVQNELGFIHGPCSQKSMSKGRLRSRNSTFAPGLQARTDVACSSATVID